MYDTTCDYTFNNYYNYYYKQRLILKSTNYYVLCLRQHIVYIRHRIVSKINYKCEKKTKELGPEWSGV